MLQTARYHDQRSAQSLVEPSTCQHGVLRPANFPCREVHVVHVYSFDNMVANLQ